MKKCVILFFVLIAMLALAIITGHNEPPILENTVVAENSEATTLDLESNLK
ncbi:MAG: hypothetical protein HKN89_05895 [Eudoraea sp.]|nr:hypothetical protein [Eudoraea sp.]